MSAPFDQETLDADKLALQLVGWTEEFTRQLPRGRETREGGWIGRRTRCP